MTAGRVSEQSCPQREVVRQEVPYVADPYQLEASLVRSKNIVTSRPEGGVLLELVPSIQVPEPTALAEVADQVYETVLHKEIRHSLAPLAPCLVEVHVQFPKDNGVLKTFHDLLQVRQV